MRSICASRESPLCSIEHASPISGRERTGKNAHWTLPSVLGTTPRSTLEIPVSCVRNAETQSVVGWRFGSSQAQPRNVRDPQLGRRGFLVHVATNGLMFLGVIAVLFFINAQLALVFAASGLCVLAITAVGMTRIRRAALKHRKKEGKLADSIALASCKNFDEAKFTKVNQSSGSHEASLMKLQGTVTWATHAIFGLAVLVSLWIGTRAIAAGEMTIGDLFMFVAYALIVQRPTVQLARQGARTGQVLAKPTQGKVLWDDRSLAKFNAAGRSQQISYLPHDPTWLRRRVGELLNLPSTVNGSTGDLLVRCGAQRTIDRLPRRLQSKVKAEALSFGERKALALARILLGNTSVWLLDDFTAAMPNSERV